jgi:hypothetical protein
MKTTHNRIYNGIPIGLAIRGTINKERIFRVRRGNGYYSSILGEEYQDQYTYFVPTSITNVEGQDARDALAQAVANWQGFSEAVKKSYNDYVLENDLCMSGFNFYVGKYISSVA